MTRPCPAREDALRLLRERFLNRTDQVAIQAPWGKPCPVEVNGTLDDLLLGHLLGEGAPAAHVSYTNRRGSGAMTGHFRVGSYCPALDDTTRWLCLDFDGAGHANALADPMAATAVAFDAFTKAGLPAYLERSGGGHGWHLWCFFDPPIPAAKAQALGRALAPKELPLASGSVATATANRGIEVFPKQKSRRSGFGNLVWLPWWQGAPEGANAFYHRGAGGALEPFVPAEFETTAAAAVDTLLASIAPARPEARHREPAADRAPPAPSPGTSDPAWADWRKRALAALPLEVVYGTWLTGKSAGAGWLECRDPASPSGDEHPSASVADGAGDAERGTFHSFISGRTISVFDFLVEHGGAADFRAARERVAELTHVAQPPEGRPEPPGVARRRKPRIVIRTEEHAVIDEAIAALSRVDSIYCRAQLLVHVIKDKSKLAGVIHPSAAARIVPLNLAGIRDRLTQAADWVALKEKQGEVEEVPAHPPNWAPGEVENRGDWPGMRYLEGVVESPVLRPDGSLLEHEGYDDATGLLYQPSARYPLAPARPTREDAVAAAAELLDVVCDFPFKSDAHRAAWLAGVLTPLARYGFRGPAPLFLMDANVRSAGKTLLADVTGEIIAGREMARTPQTPDENEEIKRITAIALGGDRIVLIDNINKPLGSGALDTVLTGTLWSERILGKSEKVTLPLLTVWYATGNNVTFKGDTARRCLHIRLDSDLERPEYREGFKHPQLLTWLHENRPRLVVAALTVLRAYCAAGKPEVGFKAWGSFEGWSGLVRSAVVWAGLADPGETRAELEEVDTDSRVLADLIAGWASLPDELGTRGCTVAEAIEALRADDAGKQFPRLRSSLDEFCPHAPGQLPTARKVGNALRRFRGRVVGGQKLQPRVLDGNNLWFVQAVNAPPSNGPAGSQMSFPKTHEEVAHGSNA
ncbi:MAG: TOTE conflict system archaeo-eukaryotic primase domain-containing protein [Deltaproteobacteria bacterium]